MRRSPHVGVAGFAERRMDEFEAVIGLEVHAQLQTRAKLFCACATTYGSPPNSNVCPVCLGHPGSLPVPNREAVRMAIKAALALGCEVHRRSFFARKNYFYPDLPKGYQITQYERPLAESGKLPIETEHGPTSIGVTRLHLEEDAGKSFHEGFPDSATHSYVDFNRAGVPLVEIVSEPQIRTPAEAYAYLRRLRQILLYIGVCSGRMEEGALRCDANVSLRQAGAEQLGAKVEVKNLNSFRFIEKALQHEISRQESVLREGRPVTRETRAFDAAMGGTKPMRGKEGEQDYRYFPDPDLPPLLLSEAWVEEIRREIPELPYEKKRRYVEVWGLSEKEADFLSDAPDMAQYFEETAHVCGDAKLASNWVRREIARLLNEKGMGLSSLKVTAEGVGGLIRSVASGALSGAQARQALDAMAETGETSEAVVRRLGLLQVSDEEAVGAYIDKILAENPASVADFRAGKEKALRYLVGQVMKESRGNANPSLVDRLLREKLAKKN